MIIDWIGFIGFQSSIYNIKWIETEPTTQYYPSGRNDGPSSMYWNYFGGGKNPSKPSILYFRIYSKHMLQMLELFRAHWEFLLHKMGLWLEPPHPWETQCLKLNCLPVVEENWNLLPLRIGVYIYIYIYIYMQLEDSSLSLITDFLKKLHIITIKLKDVVSRHC